MELVISVWVTQPEHQKGAKDDVIQVWNQREGPGVTFSLKYMTRADWTCMAKASYCQEFETVTNPATD